VDYATDEERVEELKKWWKENGMSVVLGAVLGLSILFGWRWWGDYQENQAIQASTLYDQLELAIQNKKNDQAKAFADEIIKKYTKTPYAVYSALSLSKMKIDSNDMASAKTHLQWAYDHTDVQEVKRLTGIRLARLLFSMGETDSASALVSNVDGGKFSAMYEELKGDIFLKKGNEDSALVAYKKARQLVPAGTRVSPSLEFKIDDLAKVQ